MNILKDPIDLEEFNHYEETREWLLTCINSSKEINKNAISERKRYNANNKDEIQPIQEANGYKNISREDIELFQKMLPCPYFAHLEFIQEENGYSDIEVCYIGDEMLALGSDIKVYSWTTDLADKLYYQKMSKPFLFTHKNYEFMIYPELRRPVTIVEGEYKGYANEFASENYIERKGLEEYLTAGEEVSDEFLLSVLERKKAETEITNIIRTIQQNQNTVIRLPFKKNIIVQGCAGSGKTMILLHRLSFLLERDRIPETTKSVILTPGELYNEQFKDLRENLSIKSIAVRTVESYYLEYLKKIDWKVTDRKKFVSDEIFPPLYLQEVYSTELIEWMRDVVKENRENGIVTPNAIDRKTLLYFAAKLDVSKHIMQYYTSFDRPETIYSLLTLLINEDAKLENTIQEEKTLSNNLLKSMQSAEKAYIIVQNEYKDLTLKIEESIYDKYERVTNWLKNKKRILSNPVEADKKREQQEKLDDLFCNIDLDNDGYLKNLRAVFEEINGNKEDKELKVQLQKYDEVQKKLKQYQEILQNNPKVYEESQRRIQILLPKKLDSEDIEDIKKYMEDLESNTNYEKDYKVLFSTKVIPRIEALCKKHEVDYREKSRHICYLKLWWYNINVGNGTGEYFFSIDEAQNLAQNEYSLLQKLNGEKTIFNLYGDIYQNTCPARGIQDWHEVNSVFVNEIDQFLFVENYRNTNQITKFTNETIKLPLQMKPIGYNAEEVRICKREFDFLMLLKKCCDTKTVAIVYKDLSNKDVTELKKHIENEISSNLIKILTIEEAKGLEFNTVFVYELGMTENEKYIAYTRAMEKLYIIR